MGDAGNFSLASAWKWHLFLATRTFPHRKMGSLNTNALYVHSERLHVISYLAPLLPDNSGYNRLHGTFFAKGLAGRFCLSVVHLDLAGPRLSRCRARQDPIMGDGTLYPLRGSIVSQRCLGAVSGPLDASGLRDRAPVSADQAHSV